MKDLIEKYFGVQEGGVDLLGSLKALKVQEIYGLKTKLEHCSGRVFFLGNGGSYDNARWMSQHLRSNGIKAKTPGLEDDYIHTINSKGYTEVFVEALKCEGLSEEDLVIGISGSGNSENVLKAFEFASKKGANIFALGGRDGGQMVKALSANSSLIVSNNCMEAIEDLHNFAIAIILESIKNKQSLQEIKASFVEKLKLFLSRKNINLLSVMTTQMLRTINSNGRVFILGFGIGANHFRADMGRGATNALPIRGLHCPEVFTMNSLQATANDDGTDFLLVDGLVKFSPSSKDFAIICQTGQRSLKLCDDYLLRRQVSRIEIGGNGISLQSIHDEYFDIAVSMIGHSCGQVIRTYLAEDFHVKPLSTQLDIADSQKKMAMKETLKLEGELKENGLLKPAEALTFCYGKAFAVSSKKKYNREFY